MKNFCYLHVGTLVHVCSIRTPLDFTSEQRIDSIRFSALSKAFDSIILLACYRGYTYRFLETLTSSFFIFSREFQCLKIFGLEASLEYILSE